MGKKDASRKHLVASAKKDRYTPIQDLLTVPKKGESVLDKPNEKKKNKSEMSPSSKRVLREAAMGPIFAWVVLLCTLYTAVVVLVTDAEVFVRVFLLANVPTTAAIFSVTGTRLPRPLAMVFLVIGVAVSGIAAVVLSVEYVGDATGKGTITQVSIIVQFVGIIAMACTIVIDVL